MTDPKVFRYRHNLRKRQLVLKEWHLYRVEQLKKERDLAYEGRYDQIPKDFFTRRAKDKMNELREDCER